MAKILIVDDDPSLRAMICILLHTSGHETLIARDGQEALELVKQNALDLMITDLRMPHMDGMNLLRAVKALALSMPVILITAYSSRETAAEAVKLGAFAYVAKPFEIKALMDTVGRALDAGKAKTRATGLTGGSE